MNKKEMLCYETDASRLRGIVQKVFFPTSIEEIKKIVKSSKFDIVPRGSGTSLVGGTIPNDSIVIDMSKMNRASNLIPMRKTVRVEAGITLKELNEKLYPLGLEFPIDSSNFGISTLGGMIATNAIGDMSMRYGSVRDWIEEIEFVNGSGELAKTSKADVTDVCGMEGITGVIVAATLKLAPIVQRSASAFQGDDLDEVLSIARKLRVEKEVVVLELLSPYVSKLIGFPEKYNLLIEFNSNRGKIKDEKYDEILKVRKNIFPKLFSEGYYNYEDPKLFFDKIKEFISFLEDNKVPYIAHLGVGIIHPFFKDNENDIREKIIEMIKKIKALPGKLGIGLNRKYFIESFQAKLMQRVKVRHDPALKLNSGKLIDISGYNIPKRVKVSQEMQDKESFALTLDNTLNDEIPVLTGEEISATKVLNEIDCESTLIDNKDKKDKDYIDLSSLKITKTKFPALPKTLLNENSEKKYISEKKERIEKTPEEKMEDLIKEIDDRDKPQIEPANVRQKIIIPVPNKIKLPEEDKTSKEFSFEEVKDKLNDYKETYDSEFSDEKKQQVEEIARNVAREIVKGEREMNTLGRRERVKIDYRQIQNIMTNKDNIKRNDSSYNKDKEIINKNPGEIKSITDNISNKKGNISQEDNDLINKILGNKFKKDENKNKGDIK